MKTTLRISSVFFLLFLAIGAIYGGWMLISEPSGAKFDWSVSMLNGTPFNNFLIPGIILFIANGLLPILVTVLTIIKSKNYEWLIIIQGVILIGWLTCELIIKIELFVPMLHYPLYVIGILLAICGFLLKKMNRL